MVKTYSRKRHLDVTVIEDVHQRCRLCLMRAEETVPIFQRVDDVCDALPLRIMSCVGFEVVQEDCLPNIICTTCQNELEKYYKFRKRCEESYLKLKAHVTAIKEKERITIEPVKYRIFQEVNRINEPEQSEKVVEDQNVDELAQLVIAEVCNIEEQKECQESDTNIVSVSTTTAEDNLEETTEIQVIEQRNEVSPDISTFLNTILVELGILVKNKAGFVVHNQGVSSFELETGDDDHIVFELVAEDEEKMDRKGAVEKEYPATDFTMENESNVTVDDGKKSSLKTRPNERKNDAWCSTCSRQFSSKSALRRHRDVHEAARSRPHACPAPHCRRTFAQKAVMLRHALLHAEERPFKCPACPKSYTQRNALAAHARSHAPANARALTLHACPFCDRVFLYASGLSRHMVTHSGRTFQCDTCDRPFSDRSSLRRHTRNAHPPPQEKDHIRGTDDTTASEGVS